MIPVLKPTIDDKTKQELIKVLDSGWWSRMCDGPWHPQFLFFSSRRRHTRSDRDWSSDVCSSDLPPARGTHARRRRDRKSVV